LIHYVIEQEVTTQGIILFRGVELVLIIKQETLVLLGAKSIVVENVPVAIRMK
jgi:hypothetical protein